MVRKSDSASIMRWTHHVAICIIITGYHSKSSESSLRVGICRQFMMSDMTTSGSTVAVLDVSIFQVWVFVFPDMIFDRLCLEVILIHSTNHLCWSKYIA